ncbi:E3 ubiquitin-protein ligase RNF5-like [Olea europaea var. sylvestris]|uniref:E3 ubiquitin-protein ligase RMA n=1 Tax=Olea europaea subsp. europaea TaxID=158383 RepID=A0A8S0V8I3_OLEEU|nr:E3 ubiquitin-protein ligase RNF5-like [Olea europaea var. sylvestris]CAA3026751.1 E3 ubiquitin- ligase RNF185-like [Olea europaea subsp. europaea]
MSIDAQDSTTRARESLTSSRSDSDQAGDFECNICFDLAQDPIITLCGHLYCWPCLYRWLQLHSYSHECPVCKALIREEKLIPLYGRGKMPCDSRSKHVSGIEIPNRPAGQRPATASPPDANNFTNVVLGMMDGFVPMVSATFGHFGMSAGFGGVFSPIFNVQLHGFSNASGFGATSGYHFGNAHSFHGNNGGHVYRETGQAQQANEGLNADETLKKLVLFIFALALLALFLM